MVLLTGNVGTLCFQSGPRRVLTGPRRGYFYRVWSSVELAAERGAGNAAWSKSQGRESSLLTQQFVMSVSVPACVVHVLLFVCVCGGVCVCACALYCNQMRVGSYSMCTVFRQRELSVCLFVPAMCVFVSISRKQAFPWQGRQASESAVTSANPHPPTTNTTSTLPHPPGEKLGIDTPQSEGASERASIHKLRFGHGTSVGYVRASI